MSDTDARLWHPWLRINRVLRVMLHTRWSAEAWPQVKAEFKKALALKSQVQLVVVAKRPEKKRETEQPATRRVLPMELQIGDRSIKRRSLRYPGRVRVRWVCCAPVRAAEGSHGASTALAWSWRAQC